MITLVVGATGILGAALMKDERLGARWGTTRKAIHGYVTYDLDSEAPPQSPRPDLAFLCAGTKGYAECEGNRKAFRSDVDGNIRLARYLVAQGTFVVFVSSDAVEWALHTAYARNRFMVELAVGALPGTAIFRPARFDAKTVPAFACAQVGLDQREGLTRWP